MQNPISIDLFLTNKSTSIALETGLSDHHKIVTTVFKTSFNKINPSNIIDRSYKIFDLDSFRNQLNISLHACDTSSIKYNQFKAIFMSILNKYAPIKSKTIRGNNRPFMNKTLSKSFMESSRLKNGYYKFSTVEN